MPKVTENIREEIFNIRNDLKFNRLSLQLFNYQAKNNVIYKQYLELLGTKNNQVTCVEEIPFLPISLFKTQRIVTGNESTVIEFQSSGTTGNQTSSHHVTDTDIYHKSLTNCFQQFYGNPDQYSILALLPSYIERKNSSLVYMVNELIRLSNSDFSGFYLNNYNDLIQQINKVRKEGKTPFIIGVTFALLELAENYSLDLSDCIILETGGMKGKRPELIREELHQFLCEKFNSKSIHSEYGMTELLSQAYSLGGGIFRCPVWMKVLIKDVYDPLNIQTAGTGLLSIIDLANMYSCSFISTQDLGKVHPDGSFEVLGRADNSDLRGCNLLI